jgi:UDP-2,3-diacylglucosamine pyrophosphatase LpxH
LRETAEAASWRADGAYRPIGQVDLVLLGDIFDLLRTKRWAAQPQVRPWGNPYAPELVEQITQITSDILEHNEPGLAMLRRLSDEGGLAIPPATRTSGKPAHDAQPQPVPVRIHYMVGNHDWFYHLPGPHYENLRRTITQQMGLANRMDRPFAHDIVEKDDLLATMRRHKVTARHGDLYDPLHFDGDRNTSSLGDVLVIELLNRFLAEVQTRLAGELPAATLAGLVEIDNVRPVLLIPIWIDGLLERTCSSPGLRKRVKAVWDRLVDEFLAVEFVRQRDGFGSIGLVDGLERSLKFGRRAASGWADSVRQWLHSLRGTSTASYREHALAEQDFRNRRARHIVYAHTHDFESVPLDASYAEGYVLNQLYFNTGTWRRVHRQTQLAPGQREFIAHDAMSYLAFFQGDERGGKPYETWTGTLGFNPSEVTSHRIDSGRGSHATGQSVSAPTLHEHAPHFAASPAKARATAGRRF